MIATVRPFSVEYNGRWHQVLFVYEQISDGVTQWGYCLASVNEEQLLIPAEKVTKIRADVVRG